MLRFPPLAAALRARSLGSVPRKISFVPSINVTALKQHIMAVWSWV